MSIKTRRYVRKLPLLFEGVDKQAVMQAASLANLSKGLFCRNVLLGRTPGPTNDDLAELLRTAALLAFVAARMRRLHVINPDLTECARWSAYIFDKIMPATIADVSMLKLISKRGLILKSCAVRLDSTFRHGPLGAVASAELVSCTRMLREVFWPIHCNVKSLAVRPPLIDTLVPLVSKQVKASGEGAEFSGRHPRDAA